MTVYKLIKTPDKVKCWDIRSKSKYTLPLKNEWKVKFFLKN